MKDLFTINLNDVYRYYDGELYILDDFMKISHNASYIDDHGRKVISRVPGNKFKGKILTATAIWKLHYKDFINSFDYVDKNPLNTNIDNLLPAYKTSTNRRYRIHNTSNSAGIKYVFKRKDRYYLYKYIFDDVGNIIRCTTIRADDEAHARKLSQEQLEILKKNQWR